MLAQMALDLIIPNWPAPDQVKAFQTTRMGGVSLGEFASLNLGDHVGDSPEAVQENRVRVQSHLHGVLPVWLQQVHGIDVLDADAWGGQGVPVADAAVGRRSRRACVVMTADCLPVLFCDRAGTVVAAAHAGWRGLCEGVLEKTIAAMGVKPADLMAWLGPCIGPHAFEVGDEVRAAFMAHNKGAESAFVAVPGTRKWVANLVLLARQRLTITGLNAVYGGEWCTYHDTARFFSYRRDGTTGRMASLIYLS